MKQFFFHRLSLSAMMGILLMTGCAAIHPIQGVPVSEVPEEYLSMSRSNKHTISHSLLTQPVPEQHLIDRGDVLGIYIDGVTNREGESPPVNFPYTPEGKPSIGYPFQVRDDGTISMPMYGPVTVKGMTLRQLEDHLRDFYVKKKILQEGREKIIVSLQKSRAVRVLVLRQEAPNAGGGNQMIQQGGGLNLGQLKAGTGRTVYLPAYQNDVLHALAETGGLPGLDAENAVYIIRNTNPNKLPPQFYETANQQMLTPAVQPMPQMIPSQQQYPSLNPAQYPQQYPAQQVLPQYPSNTLPPQFYQGKPPGFSLRSPFSRKEVNSIGGLEVLSAKTDKKNADWNLLKVNGPVEYVQARSWNNPQQNPTSWEQSVQQANYNAQYRYAAQQSGVIPDAVSPINSPSLPPPAFNKRGSDMGATKDQINNIDKMNIDLSKDPIYNIDRNPQGQFSQGTNSKSADFNSFTPIMQRPEINSNQDYHQPQYPINQGQIQEYPKDPRYAAGAPYLPNVPVEQPQQYNPQQYNPQQYNPQQYNPQQYNNVPEQMQGHPYVAQPGVNYPVPNVQVNPTTPQYVPSQYPAMQQPVSQYPATQGMISQVQHQGGHQISTIDPYNLPPNVIRIPIRLYPGEEINIKPEDVVLNDGDIIFIESRETEIYYTGGLLGGGQYTIPRDYDLDVLGAISIAQSSQNARSGNSRAIGGVSAINGDVTISASDVIILRKTPEGGQIPIKVDLYKAIENPAERVLIMPGDVVMLRYKYGEGVAAFIERNLLEGALFSVAAAQLQTTR